MATASNTGEYDHSNAPLILLATPAQAFAVTGYQGPQQPGDNLLGEFLDMLKSIFPELETQTAVEYPADANHKVAFRIDQAGGFHRTRTSPSFQIWM
jgi:hypothetical protein